MPQPRNSRRAGFHRELAAPRLVTIGLALVTITLALSVGLGARAAGPQQPIENFSHKNHVTVNQIECLHCHAGTDKSQLAGVPAVSVCVGCHQYVMTVRDKPGVKQLFEYWEKKEPIQWVKVHDLADFVYFDHSRHMNTKKLVDGKPLECQTCHGPIEEMDVVERTFSLKMGWCLDCHMKDPDAEHAKPGETTLAPIHCSTCHR